MNDEVCTAAACFVIKALVRPLCHRWIFFRSDLDWFSFLTGKPGQGGQGSEL